MANNIDNSAKSIAWVYRGAAILIFVVGLRSIATTLEDGEGWGFLTVLTLGALFLELILLWWYASTISTTSTTPDAEGNYNVTFHTKPLEEKLDMLNERITEINTSLSGFILKDNGSAIVEAINSNNHSDAIVNAINEINISDKITLDATDLQEELTTVTSELGLLRNDIGAINKDLLVLNEKINEFVDTGIKERVHNEVNSIIEKMVSSKK